jgi:hypothetical protein
MESIAAAIVAREMGVCKENPRGRARCEVLPSSLLSSGSEAAEAVYLSEHVGLIRKEHGQSFFRDFSTSPGTGRVSVAF